jgi:hypothetical protein
MRAPWAAPVLLVVALSGAALASRAPLPGPVPVARAGFFVFAAFAVAAFLLCLRQAERLSWRTLLLTAVACQLVVAPALPFTSQDVYANLIYGRILQQGGDPYLITPRLFFAGAADPFVQGMDPRWLDTLCVYGPLVAAFNLTAVTLGRTPAGALAVAKALALLVALLGIALAARRTRRDDARAAFMLFALNPLYAWELSGQAHNDVLLIPLLLGFACAVVDRQPLRAAAWAGASMLVKPVILPVLALAMVVPLRRRRPGQALGMLALTGAILVAGWAPLWSGPATIGIVARSLVGGHVGASNSVAELVRDLAGLASPAAATTAVIVCRALGLLLWALVGLRALLRVRDEADVIDDGLVVILVLFTVVAWFQPWYVLWVFPLALVARDRRVARLASLYGAAFLPAYLTGLYVTSWVAHAVCFTQLARGGRLWRRADVPAKPLGIK